MANTDTRWTCWFFSHWSRQALHTPWPDSAYVFIWICVSVAMQCGPYLWLWMRAWFHFLHIHASDRDFPSPLAIAEWGLASVTYERWYVICGEPSSGEVAISMIESPFCWFILRVSFLSRITWYILWSWVTNHCSAFSAEIIVDRSQYLYFCEPQHYSQHLLRDDIWLVFPWKRSLPRESLSQDHMQICRLVRLNRAV